MKHNNGHVVELVWIVFFGRQPTVFTQCQKCGERYFQPKDDESVNRVFCRDCCEDHRMNDMLTHVRIEDVATRHVVGWEMRCDSSLKRSNYNFLKVLKRDCYVCRYCGYDPRICAEMIPLHVDHVIPFSGGGNNGMNNLVCACQTCNQIASDKVFKSFLDKKIYIWQKRVKHGQPWGKAEWTGLGLNVVNEVEHETGQTGH
jgi:5-methylcytosine-specific restriction endonuclease McrA